MYFSYYIYPLELKFKRSFCLERENSSKIKLFGRSCLYQVTVQYSTPSILPDLSLESLDFREIVLPRILFDGLLERWSGAVGVPSSMGDVMELKKCFKGIKYF